MHTSLCPRVAAIRWPARPRSVVSVASRPRIMCVVAFGTDAPQMRRTWPMILVPRAVRVYFTPRRVMSIPADPFPLDSIDSSIREPLQRDCYQTRRLVSEPLQRREGNHFGDKRDHVTDRGREFRVAAVDERDRPTRDGLARDPEERGAIAEDARKHRDADPGERGVTHVDHLAAAQHDARRRCTCVEPLRGARACKRIS